MSKILTYTTILTLVFSSCIQEQEYVGETGQAKLVVKSEFDIQNLRPQISLSTSFSDVNNIIELGRDISVAIYENGDTRPRECELLGDKGQLWRPLEDIRFKPGVLYFLNINATKLGLAPVLAETVAPYPGSQDITQIILDEEKNRIHAQLKLSEPPGKNHYYHLDVFVINREKELQSLEFSRIDNAENAIHLLKSKSGILIDHRLLPEDKYLSISLFFDAFEDISSLESDYLYFNLRTVTEDYYLYYQSLDQQSESISNPFSLPEITFSNINNGYGLFTAYSSSLDSVRIR